MLSAISKLIFLSENVLEIHPKRKVRMYFHIQKELWPNDKNDPTLLNKTFEKRRMLIRFVYYNRAFEGVISASPSLMEGI